MPAIQHCSRVNTIELKVEMERRLGTQKVEKYFNLLTRFVLKPVIILPTNVGSRIWFCVHEVLKKGPPEWENKELENYIPKDVYKGNASGPTKKAVKKVIERAEKNAQRAPDVPRSLSPPPATDARRKSELISKECWRKFLECDGFLGRRNPGSSRRTQGENFPLFEKVLTATDAGKSRWLVLPRNCAEVNSSTVLVIVMIREEPSVTPNT
ncbi:Bromodomain [Artemisia annua]|uniref:Bromodomain n=1 Tax=Artemisia annua TaxID=35608 RepID=A0A2U1QIZ8_ARTAN|nr:Bromodomain [Artemisia annua]